MDKSQASTPERRAVLLRVARKSRLQWIEESAEGMHKPRSDPEQQGELFRKIPAAECLQRVLDFFANVVDDGNVVNIEALSPPDCIDEDLDDSVPIPKYGPDSDPYSVFIEKLMHPAAIDIVKSLQQFVTKLAISHHSQQSQTVPLKQRLAGTASRSDKLATEIWAYLKQLHSSMRDNVLWTSESLPQWERTMESSEKFLFMKLHEFLFSVDTDEGRKDEALSDRISSLAFLSPEHLDVHSLQSAWGDRAITKGSGENGIDKAVNRLKELRDARCPADKMRCLRDVSQLVIKVLTEGRGKSSSLPGADEFLPALILVLKEANPPHLHSTTTYLQSFIPPQKLVSEAGYILTHFVSAIHFLETVDASALTISPLEFEMSISRCREVGSQVVESAQQKTANFGGTQGARERADKGHPSYDSCERSGKGLLDMYKAISELRRVNRPKLALGTFVDSTDIRGTGARSSRKASQDRERLIRAVKEYSANELHREVLESVLGRSGNCEGLLHYYNSSPDTLTLSDVPRLCAEYRILAQACAALLH